MISFNIFTCFREVKRLNLIFVYYLNFRGLIFGGLIFGREFVYLEGNSE